MYAHKNRLFSLARALLTLCAALMAMQASGALAGDAAEFRSHGFSDDERGRYFAFEEFGVQDGSGFPYSNIYIVDLAVDKWVGGTPVRVVIDDDSQTALSARIKAFQEITPIMQKYLISNSGVLMAASPLNEVGDKTQLQFRQTRQFLLSESPEPYHLKIINKKVTDLGDCAMESGQVMGFSLSLARPNGTKELLHDETSAPKSRGCPLRYHLVAVFAPTRLVASTHAVALVGVFVRGFEGENLRYIAVPFVL